MTHWPFPNVTPEAWLERLVREGGSPAPYTYLSEVQLPPVLTQRPDGPAAVRGAQATQTAYLLPRHPVQGVAEPTQLALGLAAEHVLWLPSPGATYAPPATLPLSCSVLLVPGAPAPAQLPEGARVYVDPHTHHAEGVAPPNTWPFEPILDLNRVAAWGADPVHELAYLRLALAEPQTAAPAAVVLSVGLSVLLELGKLAALRRLLPPHTPLWVLPALTDWSATDPTTNLIRCTLQAFAAFAGGADRWVGYPHDNPLASTDPLAHRLTFTLPALLRHEGHIQRVHGPLAGAYATEHLAETLLTQSEALANLLSATGTLAQSLAPAGALRTAIQAHAQARVTQYRTQQATLVGVTRYAPATEALGKTPAAPVYPPFDPTGGLHPWSLEASLA